MKKFWVIKQRINRDFPLIKEGGHVDALIPFDQSDEEEIRQIKIESVHQVNIKEARNRKRNSLYWVLMQIVVDNSDSFVRKEQVSNYIKRKAGFYKEIVDPDNFINIEYNSLSFDKMSEQEFKAYFNHAIQIICTDINLLEGTDADALEGEVLEIVSPNY